MNQDMDYHYTIGAFTYIFSLLEKIKIQSYYLITGSEEKLSKKQTEPLEKIREAFLKNGQVEKAANLKLFIERLNSLNESRKVIEHGCWSMKANGGFIACKGVEPNRFHFSLLQDVQELIKECRVWCEEFLEFIGCNETIALPNDQELLSDRKKLFLYIRKVGRFIEEFSQLEQLTRSLIFELEGSLDDNRFYRIETTHTSHLIEKLKEKGLGRIPNLGHICAELETLASERHEFVHDCAVKIKDADNLDSFIFRVGELNSTIGRMSVYFWRDNRGFEDRLDEEAPRKIYKFVPEHEFQRWYSVEHIS